MTPTEQDKELRQKMQDIFNDCTSGWLITIKNFNGYERELGDMESEIIGDILDLITADRKRVELKARLNEIQNAYEYWINGRKFISSYFRDRIALLSNTKESKDE